MRHFLEIYAFQYRRLLNAAELLRSEYRIEIKHDLAELKCFYYGTKRFMTQKDSELFADELLKVESMLAVIEERDE